MKDSTLHTLIVARTLLEDASRQCTAGDRYRATAGLVILQDAVELVFLACLIELGVDETTALENLTFDQMIGELRKTGISVPKSGTIKAMNKLRIAAKHYGQLMEPETVQGHFNASTQAIDAIVARTVGRPIRELFLTELLPTSPAKTLLEEAAAATDRGDYFPALIAIRKAFFHEFEADYCIYEHRTRQPEPVGILGFWMLGGYKAPYLTRNPDWIEKNVNIPSDYVQLDFDRWRMDAMEWGVNTQTLANIRSLTPVLVKLGEDWHLSYPAGYVENMATRENASLCFDYAVEAIRRKSEHANARRARREDLPFQYPPAYVGQPMYKRPDLASEHIYTLEEDETYEVQEVLDGFDRSLTFYGIHSTNKVGEHHWGYVERIDAEPLHEPANLLVPPEVEDAAPVPPRSP